MPSATTLHVPRFRNAWASLSSSSLFSSMKKTKASRRVRLCARLGSAEPRPSARCETNDTRGDRIRGAGDATRVWEYASAMWRYVLLPPCHSASDHLRQSCSAAPEDHTLWACAFVTGAEQRHSLALISLAVCVRGTVRSWSPSCNGAVRHPALGRWHSRAAVHVATLERPPSEVSASRAFLKGYHDAIRSGELATQLRSSAMKPEVNGESSQNVRINMTGLCALSCERFH